jgi:hypothetical protein
LSNPSGVEWIRKASKISFGPFADLFEDLIKDIEIFQGDNSLTGYM